MAKNIDTVSVTDTFQSLLDKTNELVDLVNSSIMTASVAGDDTVGNATLEGTFTANSIVSSNTGIITDLRTKSITQLVGNTSPIAVNAKIAIENSGEDLLSITSDNNGPKIKLTNPFDDWEFGINDGTSNSAFTVSHSNSLTDRLTLSANGDLTVAGNIAGAQLVLNEYLSSTQYKSIGFSAAANTSYTWDGDLDTGMFRSAVNQVSFSVGAVETLRLAANTNVYLPHTNSHFVVPRGTALKPSVSFIDNENLGIFSPGSDRISIAAGGLEKMRIAANSTFTFFPQSPAGPTLFNFADSYVDINVENNLGIRLGRSPGTTPRITWLVPGSTTKMVDIIGQSSEDSHGTIRVDGSATAAYPAFAFLGDEDTGIFRQGTDVLGVSTGGTLRMSVSSTKATMKVGVGFEQYADTVSDLSKHIALYYSAYGINATSNALNVVTPNYGKFEYVLNTGESVARIQSNGRVRVASVGHSELVPSYGFLEEIGLGMYRKSSGVLGFSASNTEKLTINVSRVQAHASMYAYDYRAENAIGFMGNRNGDSENSPSFTWDGDNTTGFFNENLGIIGATILGDQILRISEDGFESFNQILAANLGNNSRPDIAWATDNNTGFKLGGVNEIEFIAKGEPRLAMNFHRLTSFVPHYFATGSDEEPSIAWNSNKDTGVILIGGNETCFVQDGERVAKITARDDIAGGLTIITKEKGDDRYMASSSIRYKDEIGIIPDTELESKLLDAFDMFDISSWKWGGEIKKDDERLGKQGIGLIVEDLEQILPEAVRYKHNPKYDRDTKDDNGNKDKLIANSIDVMPIISALITKIRKLEKEIKAK